MGSVAELGLRLIRQAVEKHLDADQAPKILFEALRELPDQEDVPRTPEALAEFASGPLESALAKRIGPEKASEATREILAALDSRITGRPPSIDIEVDLGPTEEWPEVIIEEPEDPFEEEGRSTLVMAAPPEGPDAALRVLVVARTTRLAQRIRASFGGHRVTVAWSSERRDTMKKAVSFQPSVVIVDGEDPAALDPIDLGSALSGPERRLVVVWASDQPFGNAAAGSLDRQGVTFAQVPRTSGVDPMLDYVRARFS